MSERAIKLESLEAKRYKDTPDAWQTKVQEFLRLPFPLPWLSLAGVLFALGLLIEVYLGHNLDVVKQPVTQYGAIKHPIILLGIQCAVIAGLTNSVILFEYLMDRVADTYPLLIDENNDKASAWISRWYSIIFWSKRNLFVGLLMAILITISSGHESAKLFTSFMKPGSLIWMLGWAYSYFITSTLGFMAGSCLWTVLGIAFMFFTMGKDVQIKSSIFDSKTSILRMASSVLWKVSLVMSLVYLLGISSVYFCDVGKNIHSKIIMVVFGAFIIAYYIVPQVNIHKHLVRLKQARLRVLVEQIDHSFDRVAEQPSPENISQLRDLFHLQNIVNGKKSWSFGFGELLALIGSIMIPLALFLIQSFWGGKTP